MQEFTIVIGTHGRFGEELVNSARMIVGTMDNVECCSLHPDLSFEAYMQQVDALMQKKEGLVIALVDLYGGTPCNVFTVLSKKYAYQVLTGLNLPLFIDLYLKLSNMDTCDVDMDAIISESIQTYQNGCVHTNKLLES